MGRSAPARSRPALPTPPVSRGPFACTSGVWAHAPWPWLRHRAMPVSSVAARHANRHPAPSARPTLTYHSQSHACVQVCAHPPTTLTHVRCVKRSVRPRPLPARSPDSPRLPGAFRLHLWRLGPCAMAMVAPSRHACLVSGGTACESSPRAERPPHTNLPQSESRMCAGMRSPTTVTHVRWHVFK